MRIALIADTHDNEDRTRAALELLADRGVEALLHMGDLTSPWMVDLLCGEVAAALGTDVEVWAVRGNIDRDARGIEKAAAARDDVAFHFDVVHDLELGGSRIGMAHGDDATRVESMIHSGAFDLVCHGHTHAFRDERVGETRVVNPGAVHRAPTPSVCVYETADDRLERIEI